MDSPAHATTSVQALDEDRLAMEIEVISMAPTSLEMNPVPAAYVDEHGTIWRANYELRKLAGSPEEELDFRSLLEFMAPDVADRHVREGLFAKAMTGRVEGRPVRKKICCVDFQRLGGEVVSVDIVIALAPQGIADDLAVVYFQILGERGPHGE